MEGSIDGWGRRNGEVGLDGFWRVWFLLGGVREEYISCHT